MIDVRDLVDILLGVVNDGGNEVEVRIGDVAEDDDLHCSVGRIVKRGGCVIVVPGDDEIWKDESVASDVLSEQLWPKENECEN